MVMGAKTVCNNCGHAVDVDKLAEHMAKCGRRNTGFGSGWRPKGQTQVPASKVEVV